MKKLLALLLVFSILLFACSPANPASMDVESNTTTETESALTDIITINPDEEIVFTELSDQNLLQYIEESAVAEIASSLSAEQFYVEHVSAIYLSKEYLEQLAFNSQENIYFGYTITELDEIFQGSRYIFTLGEDEQTIVQEFEKYDDTFDKIVRNVTIGTGVILLSVSVAIVSPVFGAPVAVTTIFAVSAKAGSVGALSGGALSGVIAGIITGVTTGDIEGALTSAALAGSEGFMWGAVTGAIAGGTQAAIALRGTGKYLQGGRGFNTFDEAKAAMGSARHGKEAHHIVSQHSANLSRFTATDIHNTRNLVLLDSNVHRTIITPHYNSIQPYSGGQRVYQWLSTQSFEQQFDYGLSLLKQHGTLTSTSSGWIFNPF